MRKDTLMMIPEIQGDKKETFDTLINLSQTKKQIEVISEQRERAEKMMGNFTDEFKLILDTLIERGVTADALKQMTDEEVDALYVKEDGTVIKLNVPTETEAHAMAFKRDFLGLLLNNKIQFDKIDESMDELNAMTAEYNEEVRNIFAEINGDVTSYVRKALKEQKETASPEQVRSIEQVLGTIEDGITLDSMYNNYKDLDPRNTINDFLRRGVEYAEQYQRNCKSNGIAADYSRFDFLEVSFLEEERYHQYRNFFIFLLVKMYARKKKFTRLDSIFLTQLVVNIQTLLYDHKRGNELNEEQLANRERLIAGIKRVLDLFYPAGKELTTARGITLGEGAVTGHTTIDVTGDLTLEGKTYRPEEITGGTGSVKATVLVEVDNSEAPVAE